jgi:hypothetical protein
VHYHSSIVLKCARGVPAQFSFGQCNSVLPLFSVQSF